jgi:uncharacterized protein (TIGR02679 family)
VQKAVLYFTQAKLHRLVAKLREKYIEIGRVGGQVLLENTTLSERREIASFLARAPYAESSFKIKLSDIEKALRHSFNCGIYELLLAFFPDQPLVTRKAKREAHTLHQNNFRTNLIGIASTLQEGSQGKYWLQYGQHGQEWIYSRFKNAPGDEQEQQLKLVRYIANVLDQLPKPDAPERLALFAQRTCGDPHALDPNMAAGRLLLLALNDLDRGQEVGSVQLTKTPQDREQEIRLYKDAGLLVDTVSSSVAVFNLASAVYHNDRFDPLVQSAGKRVLLLPMRQLLVWKRLTPAGTKIYMFENPQVFEEVIAALEFTRSLPTLVCISGWPSAAALRLLDKLLEESPDNCLYYSGDFDIKGLQIASYLSARYPVRCQLWHLNVTSYEVALQMDRIEARESELKMLNTLPDAFKPLVAKMQEKRKWAFQEGIVELLVKDLRDSG